MVTAPTRDEIERLADRLAFNTSTAIPDNHAIMFCGGATAIPTLTHGDLREAISALRLLAASIGAKPVLSVEIVQCGPGMQRLDVKTERWWHALPVGAHNLYANPQPSPDYAKGKRDGLEKAALDWLKDNGWADVSRTNGRWFVHGGGNCVGEGDTPLDAIIDASAFMEDISHD